MTRHITIRTKLVVLFAVTLSIALSALAGTLIVRERTRAVADITTNAVRFAEVSTDAVVGLYDLYYKNASYALFQSELATLMARNPSINRIEIATAEGALLFDSQAESGATLKPLTDTVLLTALKINKPALADAARVTYLAHDLHASAGYATADAVGNTTTTFDPIRMADVVLYPARDDTRRVMFHLSYATANHRAIESILYLAGLFLLGFGGALVVATWFSRSITAPLTALQAGAARIAEGDLKTTITVDTNDETRILADTFNHMTAQLGAAMDRKIDYERQIKEFEVARQIQSSILPSMTQIAGLDLTMHFTPASEVGGDVYDVLPREDGRTVFYVSDVTGHGVPAGIVAALTSAVMATAVATADTLSEIISQANAILHRKTQPTMFATMFACEWNAPTKVLSYVNAGHNPAMIYRAASETVEITSTGTLGLGMLPKLVPLPKIHETTLAQGDCLFVFTDGIVEARNAAGEMLEADGLRKMIVDAMRTAQSAHDIEEAVLTKFRAFHGDVPPADDVTFIVVRPA